MILPKDDFTDDSFESTDESDAGQDQNDTEGITHNDFKNHDVVWAKRACSPWFPSIVNIYDSFLIFLFTFTFNFLFLTDNKSK
jgi:hypothetical protein